MNKSAALRRTVLTALFTALTAAGAYIAVPIGPVPIVLQNMFVLLAGTLTGPAGAAGSMVLYLFLGAVGIPVFAGGTGGIGHFFGPTGGYLVSYPAAAFVTGFIMNLLHINRKEISYSRTFISLCAGALVIYLIGLPWLRMVTGLSWPRALAVGIIPFIPGDLVKIGTAAYITKKLFPIMKEFPDTEEDADYEK